MDDLLKRFGAEEALGCCQPGVGQHPRTGVIGVRDHVAVFEEHLLVVSAQRHHLPGIFLLQAHDPFVDLEAIGAAVAIVAEQDELGAAVAQVYRFERRVQGRDAAMYVAHGVDHGTSWVCGFRGGANVGRCTQIARLMRDSGSACWWHASASPFTLRSA